MKVILILLLLSGIWTMLEGIKLKANAVSVASDLKSFESRVAAEKEGKKILEFGGENENESFEDLIRKVNFIDEDLHVVTAGFVVTCLSGIGLFLAYGKNESNQPEVATP